MGDSRPLGMDLLVRSMALEAKDVLSLRLEQPSGQSLPSWEPGTHIDLDIPDVGVAQYSLCGPAGAAFWQVAVLHQPRRQGVSHYVHTRLRPGDRVRVGAPRNHFAFVEAAEYRFVAGGIGITPILPMLREAQDRGRRWRLSYGGRSRESMAFLSELEGVGGSVSLFPHDECGNIDLDLALQGAAVDAAVYCCGPEPLIVAVQEACAARRLPEPHVERFAAAAVPESTPPRGFHVRLARSGMTVWVPPDRSIVDVLDERDVFVPTSCREGVCGSCETAVLEGCILHRDSLLSREERASGRTMMICVSRADGDSLTLDL